MSQELFREDSWYTSNEAPEQELEGTLRKASESRVSIGRHHIYYLEVGRNRFPVYTGAKEEVVLESLLGKQVKMTGKLVTMTVDRTRKEIWPGQVEEKEAVGT